MDRTGSTVERKITAVLRAPTYLPGICRLTTLLVWRVSK